MEIKLRQFQPPQNLRAKATPSWPSWPGPIDVEIGCGVGWHPIQHAILNPDRFVIGIERTQTKFEKFQQRYRQHGSPDNLLPIHADAIFWLSKFAPPRSIDRLFILYPNPYPKRSQANLRWSQLPFWTHLITLLKPGAAVTISTNLAWYALEMQRYIPTLSHLTQADFIEICGSTWEARTHFEKKYLELGQTCYQLTFLKNIGSI